MLRSERNLVEHIAHQRGYDLAEQSEAGELLLRSALVPGSIRVSSVGDQRFRLCFDLANVDKEIRHEFTRHFVGHDLVITETELYPILGRAFELSASLPSEPLRRFHEAIGRLPSTERQQLTVQRVGQDIFRAALEQYWGNRCAITNVGDRELLRASHIKPWAQCVSDEERLDVFNGILLAAHLDAAFDKHLMTISSDGSVQFSPRLSQEALSVLNPGGGPLVVAVAPSHQRYLAEHRETFLQTMV
jgi:Predicted restriction endonuclease